MTYYADPMLLPLVERTRVPASAHRERVGHRQVGESLEVAVSGALVEGHLRAMCVDEQVGVDRYHAPCPR